MNVVMRSFPMAIYELLLRKLKSHSKLDGRDEAAVRQLMGQVKGLEDGEDLIRQGDRPHHSVIVIEGLCARYHTRPSGSRQYLSLHIAGDWPDAQALFLDEMDHSVCAIGRASVCAIPHSELLDLFRARPNVGFAVWRETLVDAAIFREAITNNSSRDGDVRIAHLFSELIYRSRVMGLIRDNVCEFPLTQTQLGEFLGMSIATVNRHLRSLRKAKAATLRYASLQIVDWEKLSSIGEFDPHYLHQGNRRRVKS
jgi:CRP-like cAMP-binding protein